MRVAVPHCASTRAKEIMEVTIKSNKERDNVKNTQTNASELNNEVIIAEIEEIVAKSSTNE